MRKFFNLTFIIISISLSSLEQEYTSAKNKFSLLVHKTPTCGCCKKWVKHLEDNSFSMMIKDHQNLKKIKTQYSIEPKYQSCHTAVSKEGYIFEGHIPSKFIKNFLADPEPNAIGLSVPGMPLGSPGMEVEGRFMPYNCLLYTSPSPRDRG